MPVQAVKHCLQGAGPLQMAMLGLWTYPGGTLEPRPTQCVLRPCIANLGCMSRTQSRMARRASCINSSAICSITSAAATVTHATRLQPRVSPTLLGAHAPRSQMMLLYLVCCPVACFEPAEKTKCESVATRRCHHAQIWNTLFQQDQEPRCKLPQLRQWGKAGRAGAMWSCVGRPLG
jgi:hypothetical protein